MQSNLQAIVSSDSSVLGSCEKHRCLEALLWLQQAGSCGGGGGQQLVTPGSLLKCMVHGKTSRKEGNGEEGGEVNVSLARHQANSHLCCMSSAFTPHLINPSSSLPAGGHTVLTVVRVLFADPWPEGLVSSLLSTVNRCARCSPGQSAAASGAAIDADAALELAAAMAAAAPSRVSREQMQAMLDAAPG